MTRVGAGFSFAALLIALSAAAYVLLDFGRLGCSESLCATVASETTGIAWVVVGTSLVTLAGPTVLPHQRPSLWLIRIGGPLAAVVIATRYLLSGGLPTWTADLTVYAAVAGLLVAAYAVGTPLERARPVVLSVLVAVLAGAVVAVPATRFVYATHAAVQPIPPVPSMLGTERFRIEAGWGGDLQVEPAGAGFVVLAPNAGQQPAVPIIAYGADGKERWRYGQRDLEHYSGLSEMSVYDDGRVVVAKFSSRGSDGVLIGLDAMTGVVLWRSSEPGLLAAFAREDGLRWPLLVDRQFEKWSRYDPRTGTPMWQVVPNPLRCGTEQRLPLEVLEDDYVSAAMPARRVDSASWVVTVIDCSTDERVDLRYVVQDPATGTVVRDEPFDAANRLPRADITANNSWGVRPVTDDIFGVIVLPTATAATVAVFIDAATGRTVDLGDYSISYGADPVTGDFVTRDRGQPGTATLRNADGSPRCTFSTPPHAVGVRFVDRHLVIEADGKARTIDRATCRDITTSPIPAVDLGKLKSRYLVEVPGVTIGVNVLKERLRTIIIGYAP